MVFRSYTKKFFAYAAHSETVTILGMKPTHPATGYGYIEYNMLSNKDGFFDVTNFHEKPSKRVAQEYLELGSVLWNICMFGGSVSVFIQEYGRYAPSIFNAMKRYIEGSGSYADIEKTSIDYAVLEKSEHVTVLPVAFPWCDVGNLSVFLSLKGACAEAQETVIQYDAHNNLVDVPGLVALVGVDDLCIVQKNGVLMVVHQNAAEKVKNALAQCKNRCMLWSYV